MTPPQLTVLDLFSGAGGMALGFEAAGYTSVGAVEMNRFAAKTFMQNFEHENRGRVYGAWEDRLDEEFEEIFEALVAHGIVKKTKEGTYSVEVPAHSPVTGSTASDLCTEVELWLGTRKQKVRQLEEELEGLQHSEGDELEGKEALLKEARQELDDTPNWVDLCVRLANMTELNPELLAQEFRPQIIVGGPPCQGFSRIGRAKQASLVEDQEELIRQGGRDVERRELYKTFLDVVRAARPYAFVMENVPAMREIGGIDVARRAAREAQNCGYNVRYFLLNSAWYGVPQHRWRLFFVGLRADLGHDAIPRPPIRTHTSEPQIPDGITIPDDPWLLWGKNIPTVDNPAPAVGVREALDDLPWHSTNPESDELQPTLLRDIELSERRPLRHTPSDWAAAHMRSWPGRECADGEVGGGWYRENPRDYRIFRDMAHNDRYPDALRIAHRLFNAKLKDLAESGKQISPETHGPEYDALRKRYIPPYRNDAFNDKWAKLDPELPSWTVTAHLSRDGYSHIHYSSAQARTITVREAARIQSFPDSFEFAGNNGEQFKQIGNAVPPLMALALARELKQQLVELGVVEATS